jgi:hypothetical protein
MDQGVADPSIVVVKLEADENMVTYLRIKLPANSRKAEGKGMDMITRKLVQQKPRPGDQKPYGELNDKAPRMAYRSRERSTKRPCK